MNTARTALWPPLAARRGELSNVELANLRLLGEARLVLVCAAMLLAMLEPAGANRVAILALLALYAGMGYTELRRLKAGERDGFPINHWIDVAFYMPVVALSGGITSDFAIFLLFPVFTACLRTGVRRGIVLGIVCGAMLAGIAWMTTRLTAAAFIAELPLASLALVLIIAIVIARWAHTEITIARRLAFCTDVGQVFTPQHDLRRAVSEFCEMLREYQQADACIVLLQDTRSAGWLLFQVDGAANAVRGNALEAALVQPLLVPSNDSAVFYRRRSLLSDSAVCRGYDPATLKASIEVDAEPVAQLAQLLEANSLVSLPLQSRNRTIGRLHLTSTGFCYTRNDIEFLARVASQVGVMIENMQLVDRLTMEIASAERRKISRDLHDGTIQPYIGLKLALEALHRKAGPDTVLVHEVDELIKMASDGISQLRHYVGHLKTAAQRGRRDVLLPAIRYQAEKFSEYYGITTEVVAEADISVEEPLFEEIMYLVREGLSNIRRHTRARSARIDAGVCDGSLTLRFSNDAGPDETPDAAPFHPRSLSERAAELGGRVAVERAPCGKTIVSVQIPV
jgi:signal transduction histidine kinase